MDFLYKIENQCVIELNACGWLISDKTDINYIPYFTHQKIDFYERRLAWIMNNIPNDAQTGCNIQISLMNIVDELYKDLVIKNALRDMAEKQNAISPDENYLFREWLYNLHVKLQNYIVNKKWTYKNPDVDYKERTIKRLTNEVRWAIKSKPKDIPEDLAKMSVFVYRYDNSKYKEQGLENFQKINYSTRYDSVEKFVTLMVEEELKNNFRK